MSHCDRSCFHLPCIRALFSRGAKCEGVESLPCAPHGIQVSHRHHQSFSQISRLASTSVSSTRRPVRVSNAPIEISSLLLTKHRNATSTAAKFGWVSLSRCRAPACCPRLRGHAHLCKWLAAFRPVLDYGLPVQFIVGSVVSTICFPVRVASAKEHNAFKSLSDHGETCQSSLFFSHCQRYTLAQKVRYASTF